MSLETLIQYVQHGHPSSSVFDIEDSAHSRRLLATQRVLGVGLGVFLLGFFLYVQSIPRAWHSNLAFISCLHLTSMVHAAGLCVWCFAWLAQKPGAQGKHCSCHDSCIHHQSSTGIETV